MRYHPFSFIKPKDKLLSLTILGLLILTLVGCPWQKKSGGDGDLKSGGESGAVVVVRSGTAAPGVSGAQFDKLHSLALNSSGQVAFKATLTGGGIANTNDEGIWTGNAESLVLVAREGTAAPGIPGKQLGDTMFHWEPPLLNDNGQIAFRAKFSPSEAADPYSQGVWVGSAANLRLVSRSGAIAPGVGSSQFRWFSDLRLNKAGQVAFIAGLTGATITTDNDEGVWAGSPESLIMTNRKGLAVTSTQYSIVSTDRPAFDGLSINDSGGVMVRAQFPPVVTHVTEPSGATGVQVNYRYGLWNWPAVRGGSLTVRPGEIARGTSVFEYLNTPAFNADSIYAFAGSYSATHDTRNSAIWIYLDDFYHSHQLVVAEDMNPPGTSPGVTYADVSRVKVKLNNHNKVAFAAGLRGAGVTSANNSGIWTDAGEGLSLLARTGNSAVGAPGATFSYLSEPLFNNTGDVAFMAALAGNDVTGGNDRGIWATREGNLTLVAREGDGYQVAPGIIRFIAELTGDFAFNDAGQVAFLARFNDGTTGLILVTP